MDRQARTLSLSLSVSHLVDEQVQAAAVEPVEQRRRLHLLILQNLLGEGHQQAVEPLEGLAQDALRLGTRGGCLHRGAAGAVSCRATEEAEQQELLV